LTIKRVFIAAAALGVLGLVFLNTSLLNGGTLDLSQAHATCTSPLGIYAQAANSQLQSDCSNIGSSYTFTEIILFAAVALVGYGLVRLFLNNRRSS
jgi:hypothetical protein